jgi:putative FmdB family regulatory protein
MPTYEYRCDACGNEFEREQRISEAPVKKCPACGKSKARRMVSSANFILKGSGWYSDGYGLHPGNGGSSGNSKISAENSSAADSDSSSASSPTNDSSGSDKGKDSGKKESGEKESGKKESSKSSAKSSGSSIRAA